MAACAVEPAPAPAAREAGSEWRVLVKLTAPSTDTDAIARRAGEISGVPVRYVAATSPQWHALALVCADDGACDAALQRLRGAASTYDSVQREQRRQPHS
jgi:hypothetical protein